ncbi:MAG: hypothetical protein AAF802_03950 [Planctomycetota bacterium]
MSEFLLFYKRPDPTTWVYLSSFLTIGLYFVFHRFWSFRNLDIVLLILLAPGLLMVHEGRRRMLREMESGTRQEQSEDESEPDVSVDDEELTAPTSLIAESDGTLLVSKIQESGSKDSRSQVQPNSVDNEKDDRGRPPRTESNEPLPSLEEENKLPLVTDPSVIDDRLESTSEDPDQIESEEEISAKQLLRRGFVTLFAVEMLLLIRLLYDPLVNRRPLLDPNLTVGGLYFLSVSLFVFMMANVATSTPRMRVWQGPSLGPGYALMNRLPTITTRPVSTALGGEEPATEAELDASSRSWTVLAKVLAISAHLAIIVALVLIGSRHFGNLRGGVGCALLYLLMPYTAQMTGRVDHALPAALLLWAVLCYRRPSIAGVFIGLAAGLVYYPLFLLPLWCSFYWQRGVRRFAFSVLTTLIVLVLLLVLGGTESLLDHLVQMFGLFWPINDPSGIWVVGWNPRWRLPVIVAFIILTALFAAWPSPKNLGTLISCSAAAMVAVQFWHGDGGGLFIAWFLPFLLLTIFRPNLEDRIATKVVNRTRSNSGIGSNSSPTLS